jgi:hypothetical protein
LFDRDSSTPYTLRDNFDPAKEQSPPRISEARKAVKIGRGPATVIGRRCTAHYRAPQNELDGRFASPGRQRPQFPLLEERAGKAESQDNCPRRQMLALFARESAATRLVIRREAFLL